MNMELNFMALWPVLAPTAAAVLVVVLDIAWPPARATQLWVVVSGLVIGAVGTVPGLRLGAGDALTGLCLDTGQCLYRAGSLTSGLQLLALVSALVVVLLAWSDWSIGGGGRTAVLSALLLGATAGVVAVPAAQDLASLLVAIELATLPSVALVALEHRASRVGQAIDGAVALLTTSLVSFALLAVGAALWVSATGTAVLSAAATRSAADDPQRLAVLSLAAVFALSGMAFKLSAVPFHAWTPLTYRGASLPVTVYLATTSKVAALGGVIVIVGALSGASDTSLLAVAVLAAASMTFGNAVALRQDNLIGLLAWSTVAQAGWVVLPLATLSTRATRASGSYLAVYAVATLLAFVVVIALSRSRGLALADHQDVLHTRPLMGLPLGFALLTLAGLPPAVVGLVAKVVVIRPVAGDGMWWLAVIAAFNVALGIAVYLRWLMVLARRPVRQDALTEAEAAQATSHRDLGRSSAAVTPVEWSLVGILTAALVWTSIVPIGLF
ncbi:MAG: proton-conducting transporter membrane subunit [Ornithinimicrobium sp.]